MPVNRTEFDEFLFAPLGDEEEENGMTLSVVSALARLGFDPWREAARLAGLPKPQAAAVLAGLFDRLPVEADQPPRDTPAQAARLIGLLPSAVAPPVAALGKVRVRLPRLGLGAICLVLVLSAIAITLTMQNLSSRDAPAAASISARR
jgi:hypothetical protein